MSEAPRAPTRSIYRPGTEERRLQSLARPLSAGFRQAHTLLEDATKGTTMRASRPFPPIHSRPFLPDPLLPVQVTSLLGDSCAAPIVPRRASHRMHPLL
eukprot:scaffold5038_cov112-Isochrysis_galbana.AAC.5